MSVSVNLVGATVSREFSDNVCLTGDKDASPPYLGFNYASFFKKLTVPVTSTLDIHHKNSAVVSKTLVRGIVLRASETLQYAYAGELGVGSFGLVVKLQLQTSGGGAPPKHALGLLPSAIALKLSTSNPPKQQWLEECDVVKSLADSDETVARARCYDRIPAAVISDFRPNDDGTIREVCAVVMRAASGALNKVLPIKGEQVAFQVLQAMFEEVRCLYKTYKYLHVDVKPANFLYSCESGQARVQLADYGGCHTAQTADDSITAMMSAPADGWHTGGSKGVVGTWVLPWLTDNAGIELFEWGVTPALFEAPFVTESNTLSQFAAVFLQLTGVKLSNGYPAFVYLTRVSSEKEALLMLEELFLMKKGGTSAEPDAAEEPLLSPAAKEFISYCLRYDRKDQTVFNARTPSQVTLRGRFLERKNNVSWDDPLTFAKFEEMLNQCLPPSRGLKERAWAHLEGLWKARPL
jgi:hypothetical protein